MRPFLLALAILVILIATVVVIGALLPKHHIAERTAMFDASSEQLFHLISGPQDWRTDLREYKLYDDSGRHMIKESDKGARQLPMSSLCHDPQPSLGRQLPIRIFPLAGLGRGTLSARAAVAQ